MYGPGFKAVFAEFPVGCELKVFEPSFERVSMVPVRIRLTYHDGKPIANEQVRITLSLCAPKYFGYFDGCEYQIDLVSAFTDSSGEFVAQIPPLLDDPYFKEFGEGQVVSIGLQDPKGIISEYITLETLAGMMSHKDTVVIKLFHRAILHGQIRQSFLKRNKIKNLPNQMTFWAFRDKQGSGC
jgi:hypothetical protein